VQLLAERVVVLRDGQVVTECAPDVLAERLGLRSLMHLRVVEEDGPRALDLLTDGGFEAWRNGGPGVHVRVAAGQKAEVLRRLDGAGLRVLDFDVENDAQPARNGGEG